MTTWAELSSLTASIEELQDRISAMAERARAAGDDDAANELFGIERSLLAALRRAGRLAAQAAQAPGR
ncbi:MAG: hypothetical protein M0Z95_03015 [Actinomycetota bacterium]|nr:hypothetical protein [Actinomycetota bacterium]